MELDFLEAQPFGLTPKRGEGHESDETTASADRVAKLGSGSYPVRCRRILARSRRRPNYWDNRGCGRAHPEVARRTVRTSTGHVPSQRSFVSGPDPLDRAVTSYLRGSVNLLGPEKRC